MYVTARFSFYLSRIDLFYSCVNWGERKIGHRLKKSSVSHDDHNWLGQHRSELLEYFFCTLLLSLFAPFLYLTRLEKMKSKILSTVDSPGLFVSKARSIGKWSPSSYTFKFYFVAPLTPQRPLSLTLLWAWDFPRFSDLFFLRVSPKLCR